MTKQTKSYGLNLKHFQDKMIHLFFLQMEVLIKLFVYFFSDYVAITNENVEVQK